MPIDMIVVFQFEYFSGQNPHPFTKWNVMKVDRIRRRSYVIIGFVAPAIGPNKSKKLTRLISPTHNIRGKV